MRLSTAAAVLGISRSGIRDEIFVYNTLHIANEKERELKGPTSPIKVFASEVTALAEERGIL